MAASIDYNPVVYDFLQNSLTDGLWYWNLLLPTEGWVNATFWQTLGYAPDQVPADPAAWRGCIDPAELTTAWHKAEAYVQDPAQGFDLVLRCTHREASPVWLRCRGMALHDDSGRATWLVVALFDVTKEKQKEAYVEEVATHYSSILSNQSVYILKTDPRGNYTYVNDFFYERFGWENDLIGTSSLLSIIEEDWPKCLEVVTHCFRSPHVPHQVILRKLYHDGSIKSNHWEFKGVLGEDGQLKEILCVGYDVTLLLENLHRAQHLLDVTSQQNLRLQNFAYIISHNIRSHSANLTSLVQLLAEAKGKAQKTMFMQMLTTSTEQLADTIVNLNDIVTINNNVNKPKASRALKGEIDKTLEALSVLIRQHHITVEVDVPPTLTVTVVPAYLDSILLNLISNAIKYRATTRPAYVRLWAQAEPGSVVLTVQDNGLGIDLAKYRTKLFGMYKTFHDNEDARGVGLFITKNQVEAMQGTIQLESEVDVGTTFTIQFNEGN
ncbi:PAS domain-containing sensor histidine kinase [Hymenobacter sp. BRD128]|uniref:PAS domain-containing sensor histidine kinase n=1 Tax=Hymenobacter sp. BRD128 TaxID=2675878 RepID=UPI001565E2ED|nr:PAS domain-containing sensor histidine kinase [Hymenobacter sp. BRD128]QKG57694.1 PAS domain-containing sensor histidine kinase [Hymenobacter sp. BRD128]